MLCLEQIGIEGTLQKAWNPTFFHNAFLGPLGPGNKQAVLGTEVTFPPTPLFVNKWTSTKCTYF